MKLNKTCKNCKKTSEQTQFWQSCKRMCIDCKKEQNRKYTERVDYNRTHYNKNKEEIRDKKKQYYHSMKYYDKNKQAWRENQLKVKYGINSREYNEILQEQESMCKICKKPHGEEKKKRLHVDHCHTTGKIRGLLCGNCNTGIGLFNDSKELLSLAIEYLKNSKTKYPLT